MPVSPYLLKNYRFVLLDCLKARIFCCSLLKSLKLNFPWSSQSLLSSDSNLYFQYYILNSVCISNALVAIKSALLCLPPAYLSKVLCSDSVKEKRYHLSGACVPGQCLLNVHYLIVWVVRVESPTSSNEVLFKTLFKIQKVILLKFIF